MVQAEGLFVVAKAFLLILNAPLFPNFYNPPFTSPLYTKGACPLFAHASFLLIGKSLFLNPRTIRGHYTKAAERQISPPPIGFSGIRPLALNYLRGFLILACAAASLAM